MVNKDSHYSHRMLLHSSVSVDKMVYATVYTAI